MQCDSKDAVPLIVAFEKWKSPDCPDNKKVVELILATVVDDKKGVRRKLSKQKYQLRKDAQDEKNRKKPKQKNVHIDESVDNRI